MSRHGTKRNGDTNALVDALLPLAEARLGNIDRNTLRARITNTAKAVGFTGVGELVDDWFKPVRQRNAVTTHSVTTETELYNRLTVPQKRLVRNLQREGATYSLEDKGNYVFINILARQPH